ncbi:MAG TPA: FtsX-like permease family protein [Candidatus Limnocylindria bacterium]
MRLSAFAWRSLSARPGRTLLTALGVALGVALVTGTLLTADAATRALSRAATDLYGEADLRVRAFNSGGLSEEAFVQIRTLPGVAIAAPVTERRLTISTLPGPDEQVFTLLTLGVDPASEAALGRPQMAAGSPLDTDHPHGALVSSSWAAEHGLGIGDELLLTGSAPDVPPIRIQGLLTDTGFGALSGGSVLVLARETLDTAFALPAPLAAVDVNAQDGREGEVEAGLERVLTEPFVLETVADATAAFERAQAGFSGIAFLLGLIALVAGGFLVANTLVMTLAERTREVGLLRAAGATGRQVRGLVLRQGVALGVIGASLGLVLGIGIGAILVRVLAVSRAAMVDALSLSPGVIVFAFVLGLVVTILAAWFPAAEAARVSPLEAVRPTSRSRGTLVSRLRLIVVLELGIVIAGLVLYPADRGEGPVISAILAVGLLVGLTAAAAFLLAPLGRLVGAPFERFFGAQGLLGRANLGRDRARTGLSVAALTIALAAVVTVGATAASARGTAERWVESILPGGHAIRLANPSPIDALQETIEATSGTLYASPIADFGVVASLDGVEKEMGVAGIDPTVWQDAGSLIVVSGERSSMFDRLRAGGAVVLPDAFAQASGLAVGDTLDVAVPGGVEATLEVAGVVAYSLPGRTGEGALLVSLEDARTIFGADLATLWAMVPQPMVSDAVYTEEVALKANQLAGEGLTAAGLADQLNGSLDRLLGLFDLLALVSVVIGAIGIVNTLTLGVTERAREIAVLRAHGMTVGQVQGMVVTEAAIMGTVGGLLAVTAGLAVTWLLVSLAPRDFAAGLVIPWPLVGAIILLGLGVAAAAGIYPARRASTGPLLANLKQFE